MPVFMYEAGEEIKGTVEANSETEAQQKVRNDGYFLTNISRMEPNPLLRKPLRRAEKVNATPTLAVVAVLISIISLAISLLQ